jgi:hypothetical protein
MRLINLDNANYSSFHRDFYTLEGSLNRVKGRAFQLQYEVNNIIGGRRSSGLVWSDLALARSTIPSGEAYQKVISMQELLYAWNDAAKVFDELHKTVIKLGEVRGFTDSGYGTDEEKAKAKDLEQKVLVLTQEILDSRTRFDEAENKAKGTGCEIWTPFREVVTRGLMEMKRSIHRLA